MQLMRLLINNAANSDYCLGSRPELPELCFPNQNALFYHEVNEHRGDGESVLSATWQSGWWFRENCFVIDNANCTSVISKGYTRQSHESLDPIRCYADRKYRVFAYTNADAAIATEWTSFLSRRSAIADGNDSCSLQDVAHWLVMNGSEVQLSEFF